MKLKAIALVGIGAAAGLAACGPAPTPQQQAARQHENCLPGRHLGRRADRRRDRQPVSAAALARTF